MTSTKGSKASYPLRGGKHPRRIVPLRSGDPIVGELYQIALDHSGTLSEVFTKAGICAKTSREWFVGRRSPSLINLTAVLQVLGYRLRIERIPEE